ncbi:hypothetical protein NDU88_007978 [Pleurodeles waltl]|uniref:Uncharacterized protein n=1 Tax=Pleurodeles waltl TaxID=8319 RepID=A0AAV7N7G1_PLEWA|nr:hypothetical protein NDU88_007978 [Pleurodeles waltl]
MHSYGRPGHPGRLLRNPLVVIAEVSMYISRIIRILSLRFRAISPQPLRPPQRHSSLRSSLGTQREARHQNAHSGRGPVKARGRRSTSRGRASRSSLAPASRDFGPPAPRVAAQPRELNCHRFRQDKCRIRPLDRQSLTK